MSRDNFTSATKSALARNVHFRCVYQGCPNVTHASTPHGGNVNVGQAAHVSAAAAGGPRFDEELTPEQRRAYENGAWLCALHAKLVDDDPKTFPRETIQLWQRKMEASARDAIYGSPMNANFDFSEICRKLELFLKACRKAVFPIYLDPKYIQISRECVIAMQELLRECPRDYWRPVHQWHSLHPLTHGIQVRAIDAVRRISHEINDYSKWYNDGHTYVLIAPNVYSPDHAEQTVRATQTAATVSQAAQELADCMAHLNEYAAGRRHPGNIS